MRYFEKIRTPVIFSVIWIGSGFLMVKLWTISADPAFVGGICLALFWLINDRVTKLQRNINLFAESIHNYLLDPRDLKRYHVKSYIWEAAICGISEKIIVVGMTVDEVNAHLRKLIAKRISNEIKQDSSDQHDATNFATGWDLFNTWCENEKQLPEEAFRDNVIFIGSDKKESALLVNKLTFPAQYAWLYFNNKKLTGWKIPKEES